MARKKIKSATDQRKFTLVYNDFLESTLLDHYEKLVFIALKRYADNNTMKAFPSLNKLQTVTGISLSQVRRSINHMKELGVIKIEHRNDEIKGNKSNVYTLYDYAEIWSVDTDSSEEQSITITEQILEMKLVAELQSKGYFVIKEKELASDSVQTTDTSTQYSPDINKNTTNKIESQAERYAMEDIKELYEYDDLLIQYPEKQTDIDIVFDILYDALNTQKQTIRVNGEDKPRMVVIGKLMKLQSGDLVYAIDKYHEQTERIKNVKAYLLTILYHAKEQFHLDLMNLGHHNGDF